ncbi:hypothetical protein [Curtanaerobium respiraculi]|uniref:hypothetical protein n=1 Tax=Curtanaerobium respiraculi TaxID=2949669 RepID=UPI0024B35C37|nr:hypothetical protein [Curtanaerobium respiraculi]
MLASGDSLIMLRDINLMGLSNADVCFKQGVGYLTYTDRGGNTVDGFDAAVAAEQEAAKSQAAPEQ